LKINGYLAKIPLFKGLPENQLNDLSKIVIDQVLKRGEIIFSEGDEGKGFYIVVEGRVKIYKLSSEGKEKILHIFGPGEPFGEVPVFAGQHFPANAETLEKCRVFFLPRNRLIEQIERNPSLALNMLAILSKRLRQFTVQIEHLSLKEVPGRLAAYLLYASDREGGVETFRLDITKGQLASLLGTIPETLSRIFSKMNKQGLIDVSGPHISILDRAGLEELAETAGSMT
jgi:CRP/FNR family transcriptional regulator